METTIRALVENTAQRRGVIGEHGVAFLVETAAGTVLFDTGQGRALLPNATELDVELGEVERIVLSHGHFDHTGGLRQLLDRIGPREVFAHPDALTPKYSVRGGKVQSIGIPETRGALERAGARLHLHEGPAEIIPGVRTTGRIPRETGFEEVSTRFQVRLGAELTQDEMRDDQALVVDTEDGPVVVLGCAHAGLINTLICAEKLTGQPRFAAVIGGTHLVDADPSRLQRTIEALGRFEIGRMAPCHCTGFRGQVALWEAFGDRFVLNTCGDVLVFGDSA